MRVPSKPRCTASRSSSTRRRSLGPAQHRGPGRKRSGQRQRNGHRARQGAPRRREARRLRRLFRGLRRYPTLPSARTSGIAHVSLRVSKLTCERYLQSSPPLRLETVNLRYFNVSAEQRPTVRTRLPSRGSSTHRYAARRSPSMETESRPATSVSWPTRSTRTARADTPRKSRAKSSTSQEAAASRSTTC